MAIRPPGLALARLCPGPFFIGPCLARPNIPPGRAVPSPAQYPTEPCRASPRALLAAQVRARGPISCRAAPAEPGTTTEFGPPEAHPRRGGGGDGRRCGDEEAAGVGVAETRRRLRPAGGDEAAALAGIWWMRQSPGFGGGACPHSRTRWPLWASTTDAAPASRRCAGRICCSGRGRGRSRGPLMRGDGGRMEGGRRPLGSVEREPGRERRNGRAASG